MDYTRGELEKLQAGVYSPVPVTTVFDGTDGKGKVSTKAALTTSLTGTNNDMVFTADTAGAAGNGITVEYNITHRAPGHSSAECHTSGKTICVDLKTSAGVAATGVLTSDNTNVADAATVTIGAIVYRFKSTMAQAYDVKIGADADTSMNNLIKAINGTGTVGTHYYTGTVAHTLVTAGTLSAHAFTVTAKSVGDAGNLIAKDESSTHLDWDGTGAYLTGGEDVNQVLSTAAEVKTAIEANTEAAALVDIANSGADDGSGVVTVMAATSLAGGSDGTITLFTIEQDGLIAVLGDCSEDLAGNSATIAVGVSGNTAALIPQTTATTLDNLERIDKTGVIATTVNPSVTPFFPVRAGDVVIATIGTASITDGTVDWQLFYSAFNNSDETDVSTITTNTTALSSATGTTADAAVVTDTTGTISGKLRGLVKMFADMWNSTQHALRVTTSVSTIGHGSKTVTTAGTDVPLAAVSTPCRWVTLQAYSANQGYIATGGAGVNANVATGTGVLLAKDDVTTIYTDNLTSVYINSTINGEGVRYTYGV